MRANLTGDAPFSLGAMARFTGMEIIGAALGAVGTAVNVVGTIAQGRQAEADAKFEAEQYRRKGQEALAVSQRTAEDKTHEMQMVLSRQQALTGASGLGALDPTVVDLAGDTFQKGTYNARMAVASGRNQQNDYYDKANATIASGRAAEKGAMLSAFGEGVGGLSNFFTKYAGGQTPGTASSGIQLYDDTNAPRAGTGGYY
jgi:hypothetical protein